MNYSSYPAEFWHYTSPTVAQLLRRTAGRIGLFPSLLVMRSAILRCRTIVTRITVSVVSLLGLACPQALFASGVFIVNQSASHPPATSKAMRYSTFRKQGEVTTFILESGQSISITMFQPLVILPDVDTLHIPVIGANETADYSRTLAEYKGTAKKYPNAKPLLQVQIASLEEIVTNLMSGKEWFEGSWRERGEIAEVRSRREADFNRRQQEEDVRKRDRAIDLELAGVRQRLSEAQLKLRDLRARQDIFKQERDVASRAATEATSSFQQFLKR